ncbi:alpha/beta hydrolase [Sinomonas sp. ASV322]|uniref:alpha/beta fold hydrolase n=1 Tax=Sinomonas sp. ASV322 TaxID=3041920 RepID=UPI0027DE93AB|nr:alpha/beta hydrolase [Sinomonas sp. ASV322]MDQ4501121.1 alpha/beta hydrolase [Sinomonas sp. ASV322]
MVATAQDGFLSPGLDARERRSTVTVLGAATAVFTYEPEGGAGASAPTVLAVHGFRGTHHGLLRIVDRLPGVRIVMPDLPGFGASAPLDVPHDIAGYTAWLGALADTLGLGRDAVLLGHSFGSIVAAHFVARHPDRFSRLILVNPISAPALEGPKGLLSRLAVVYYRAGAALPAPLGAGLLRHPLIVRGMSEAMAKTRDGDLRSFVHGQHASHFSSFASRDMLLESFEASVSHTAAEVADQLRLPVLLIAGDRDEVAPLAAVRRFHERLADSRLTVIPGVGHLIHYETPQPAAESIREFLAEEVQE